AYHAIRTDRRATADARADAYPAVRTDLHAWIEPDAGAQQYVRAHLAAPADACARRDPYVVCELRVGRDDRRGMHQRLQAKVAQACRQIQLEAGIVESIFIDNDEDLG